MGDPRHRLAVFESRNKVAFHFNMAIERFDNANDSRVVSLGRHKVRDADTSLISRKSGFKDQRAWLIAAPDLAPLPRGKPPKAVVFRSKQLAETIIGIKPGQAKPINGAVSPD